MSVKGRPDCSVAMHPSGYGNSLLYVRKLCITMAVAEINKSCIYHHANRFGNLWIILICFMSICNFDFEQPLEHPAHRPFWDLSITNNTWCRPCISDKMKLSWFRTRISLGRKRISRSMESVVLTLNGVKYHTFIDNAPIIWNKTAQNQFCRSQMWYEKTKQFYANLYIFAHLSTALISLNDCS